MGALRRQRVYPSGDSCGTKRYDRKHQRSDFETNNEYGNENIYKVTLKGRRDTDIVLDTARMASNLNVLEIIDKTVPRL